MVAVSEDYYNILGAILEWGIPLLFGECFPYVLPVLVAKTLKSRTVALV
jgi:hypothetical protein